MRKIAVIGAGAAGLMAAIKAAENKENSVFVFEKNSRAARKVMITGKGRCNVTNNTDLHTVMLNVPKNPRFLYSAFSAFSPKDTMDFFENEGVPLKTERGNRVFPVSDKAVDIVDALVNKAQKSKVKFVFKEVLDIITENGEVKGIVLINNEEFLCDAIIIATGGVSYPLTGSTGDGYTFAKTAGHTVTEIAPSLISLVCHEGFCSSLAGLSLKNVGLTIFEHDKKKPIFEQMGELLFTHFGISGPLVLSASAYMKNPKQRGYYALIDLKPALSIEQLDNRILRDFSESNNKDFSNSLNKLLPKSLIPVIIKLSGIETSCKVNQISREQRRQLCFLLKNFKLTITDFGPIEEAIITRGGVAVKEINPATMESKLVKGLFFAGEVIDVDALTGGFNLQIAFSTGFVAGKSV